MKSDANNQKAEHMIMKELPKTEQPYEKCILRGAEYLSDAELLAVIIRTGSRGERCVDLAQRILCRLPGQRLEGLLQMSLAQLQEIYGIGRVKAVQLQCLAECGRRMGKYAFRPAEKLVCDSPEHIAEYYMNDMQYLETEQVRLLVLDGKNAVSCCQVISEGGFDSSYASPREIYYYALKHRAVSIVLMHNHPSGDCTPSRQDIMMTKRVAETGAMIGIPLLDHIIIGWQQYTSFLEDGYLECSKGVFRQTEADE